MVTRSTGLRGNFLGKMKTIFFSRSEMICRLCCRSNRDRPFTQAVFSTILQRIAE
jgi:hypothetical protein